MTQPQNLIEMLMSLQAHIDAASILRAAVKEGDTAAPFVNCAELVELCAVTIVKDDRSAQAAKEFAGSVSRLFEAARERARQEEEGK